MADVLGELVGLRKKLEKAPWHKRDELELKIAEAERRLQAAEVRALPMPAAGTWAAIRFDERDVPLSAIVVTGNHREHDDEVAAAQLARTIRLVGLQQRIGVKDLADGRFELIYGNRRFTAFKLNGELEIPAKVYPASLTAAEVEILRTIENFGRKDLSHVERAIAIARTLDAIEKTLAPLQRIGSRRRVEGEPDAEWQAHAAEFRKNVDLEHVNREYGPDVVDAVKLTQALADAGGLHAYVGLQLGFPAKWVQDNAYVSQLGGETRALLAAHRLDVGHARELAKLGDKEKADQIARCCCRNEKGLGGSSVEDCRRMVVEAMRSLKTVPWQLDVAFGKDKPGCTGHACATCPFNSKSDPDLFGGSIAEEPAAGICTNEQCFRAKQEIVAKDVERAVKEATKRARKDDTFRPTENTMISIVPRHVKPATAARKAAKEIAPPAEKGAARDEHSTASSPGAKRTLEQVAEDKLEQATGKWSDHVANVVRDAAWGKPGRALALSALDVVIEDPWDVDADDAAKLRHLIVRSYAPDLDDLLAIEKEAAQAEHVEFRVLEDTSGELLQEFALAWDLTLPPKPVLEDFLPKQKPEKASAKNAKGSKAEKGGDDDDDGFEDPDGSASAPAEIRRFINNQLDEEKPFAWKVWNRCTGPGGEGGGGDNPDAQHPGLSLFTRTRIRDALKQFAEDEGIAWSDPDETDVEGGGDAVPVAEAMGSAKGAKGTKGKAAGKQKGGRR